MEYLDYGIKQSIEIYLRNLIKKSKKILSQDFYYDVLNIAFVGDR